MQQLADQWAGGNAKLRKEQIYNFKTSNCKSSYDQPQPAKTRRDGKEFLLEEVPANISFPLLLPFDALTFVNLVFPLSAFLELWSPSPQKGLCLLVLCKSCRPDEKI